MHVAAHSGQILALSILTSGQVLDVNFSDCWNLTPLDYAIAAGEWPCAVLLLSQGGAATGAPICALRRSVLGAVLRVALACSAAPANHDSAAAAGEAHDEANNRSLTEAFASAMLPKLLALRTSMRQALSSRQCELMAMGLPMGAQEDSRRLECDEFNKGVLTASLKVPLISAPIALVPFF